MKNNIAIIPARSGSFRIKNKNIKKFYGKPIISWPLNNIIGGALPHSFSKPW